MLREPLLTCAAMALAIVLGGCAAPSATDTADSITEKYWKLVELNGKPVPRLEREPSMTLRVEGMRVTGFGGCNNFAGSYVLDAPASRIRFHQIAMTERACVTGGETESAFLAVLRNADNYSHKGDTLSLNRARMAPLARFEAIYLR